MKNASLVALTSIALSLTACGGAQTDNAKPANAFAARITQAGVNQTLAAADYATVVQQLYVSYFGRPADTGGFANFKSQMAEIGAPNDIQLLITAYKNDARVRSLVDSFGSSAESAALYGGDNTAFVTAIYTNVLGRAPDAGGLAFWVGAIDSGELTRARASLDIMAGALANATTQGQLDAALVNKKITVATSFTDSLNAAPVNGYSGDAAAARARTMLSGLTATTDTATYQAAITSTINELAVQSGQWALRAPMATWLGQAGSISFLVSGVCTGSVAQAFGTPSQGSFDGSTRTAVASASVWQFIDCTPLTFNQVENTYYDSNYTIVGSAIATADVLRNATEFVTFTNPASALPVSVKVGDSGTLGVAAVYTSSAKTGTPTTRTYSYAITADDSTTRSAIATVTNRTTDSSGTALLTIQTKYRLNSDFTLNLIAENIVRGGVNLTKKAQPTALTTTDTVVGTGTLATAGKVVTVNYTGWLYDPTVGNRHGIRFDTSLATETAPARGPFSFTLGAGGVIAGWDQGVAGMRVGGKRTLIIPSSMGYGAYGAGNSIPPNAGLVFDVEVINVQ